jgi:hypothetical protein
MIDDMGAHHVLQTTRNPPVNAPRIRRSTNGFRASMALCPRVPGLHIANSCSGSPHPARPTTRIRAHRKRSQRLSRHSDTSDCSERLAKKECSDPEQCSNLLERGIRGVEAPVILGAFHKRWATTRWLAVRRFPMRTASSSRRAVHGRVTNWLRLRRSHFRSHKG